MLHNVSIIGQGSRVGYVHPSVFAGTPHNHGGGIAGLKPLEQPAVLLEGEVALMEDYPQHIRNLRHHGFATLKWQF